MGLLESVIAGILSRVVYDEATAWSPKLSRMLLMLAVKTMPKLQRDRCHEEWQAWIDECSGNVSKVVAALGFLIAAQLTNVANVFVASRVLLNSVRGERAFVAGHLAGIEEFFAKHELTPPLTTSSADPVSLYYILQMRVRRVLNIAQGAEEYDGVGEIARRALKINLESAIRERFNE